MGHLPIPARGLNCPRDAPAFLGLSLTPVLSSVRGLGCDKQHKYSERPVPEGSKGSLASCSFGPAVFCGSPFCVGLLAR